MDKTGIAIIDSGIMGNFIIKRYTESRKHSIKNK